MEILFKVLLVVSCCYVSGTDSTNICITTDEYICVNCSSSCDTNITMQELVQGTTLPGNINIIIYLTVIQLDGQISIQNILSLLIESHTSSLINCSERNSGFKFINTTNIILRNLEIKNCGVEHNSTLQDMDVYYQIPQSSVYFINSSNINIINVNITNSNGTGLSMVDTEGDVRIENCTFENNTITDYRGMSSGGGGLLIEFSHCLSGGRTRRICKTGLGSHYTINRCMFKHNIASTVSASESQMNFQGSGRRGGGLSIIIKGYSRHNSIDVTNCTFSSNSAIWGGGLYMAMQDSATNNTICINRTVFVENHGTEKGGGGRIDLNYPFTDGSVPEQNRNSIYFNDCDITQNSADDGGGISVYSYCGDLTIELNFKNCQWISNSASFGAAVTIATDNCGRVKRKGLVTTLFKDCSFESNIVSNIDGKGTFRAVEMDIKFAGNIDFNSNNGTGLFLQSSNATFSPDTNIHFTCNEGEAGGAISITGLSYLVVDDNSTYSFVNNVASEKGGAIYQSLSGINVPRNHSRCFIQYVGAFKIVAERGIKFDFLGNKIASSRFGENASTLNMGDSIYASTLYPCYNLCTQQRELHKTFDCIANFTFGRGELHEISTSGEKFDSVHSIVNITPGGWLQLPTLRDELNNQVTALYHISVLYSQTGISLATECTTDKWVKLYGSPGINATLQVETTDVWEVAVAIDVHMTECPPGYEHRTKERNVKSCECAATSNVRLYAGIVNCSEAQDRVFRTNVRNGYWLGYDNYTDGYRKELELQASYCPIDFCVHSDNSVLMLPNSTDAAKLDGTICGYRTGRLCARCRGNLTSYYHTVNYECRSSEKCNIGWLLFIVSEIIPITVFFIVIIVFDISCTDGAVNGLIFYFQVTYLFIHLTRGLVRCECCTDITDIYSFITGIFNLKFFYHRSLSFCLWQGAQALDLVTFRYVKIIYSLLLVLGVIGILRICNLRKILPRICAREIATQSQSTMIHGLCGFLVMCYSECTKVSILLLVPAFLYGHDEKTAVVFFNGELKYFHGKHLAYAIPALVFLILFGFGPPLLLLSYPLCYKIFGLLKIGETKFVKVLCMLIPLERFKPFFDSLQSSFKDEYRFYSGLYFLYRLLLLLAATVINDIADYFTAVTIGFSFLLCFHAMVQPYKKRWHNIIDGYIITSLLVLSVLSLYSYRWALENHKERIRVACIIKTVVILAPLVYSIVWILKIFASSIIQKLKEIKQKQSKQDSNICEQELTESLLSGGR